MKTKSQQILDEANAAAERAAALTVCYRKDNYSLKIEDPELWQNLLSLSTTYSTLEKLLRKRAELEDEREKAKAAHPRPVHAGL